MLVDGDAYTGYVSVGAPVSDPYDSTTEPLAYVRPHPTHSGKYILSQLWTVANQPLFPVSASIRQTVQGSYTMDMEAMTCTCQAFVKGSKRVPVHRRTCKHLERAGLLFPEYPVDLVFFLPRSEVLFQLFGNHPPKSF